MSTFSQHSSATFLSEEGVYFETKATQRRSKDKKAPMPPQKWSNAKIQSAESQTSISLIHIEVVATRGTPISTSRRSVFSLFDQLGSNFWLNKQQEHQSCNLWWGWHPAKSNLATTYNKDFVWEKRENSDAENEADLSGWSQCGFVYGSGVYDGEDEDEE